MRKLTTPSQRNSRELSRRRFLRGTGVVMALPWLESLPVWGVQPLAAASAPSEASAKRSPRVNTVGMSRAKQLPATSARLGSRRVSRSAEFRALSSSWNLA
jgi:hypothetical protein